MTTFENLEGINFEEQRKLFGINNIVTPSKVNKLISNSQLWDILSYIRPNPKLIIDLLGDNIDVDCIITEIDVDFYNNITISFIEHFDIEGKEKPSSITIGNDKIPEIAKRVETHKKLI